MKTPIKTILAVAVVAAAGQAMAQVTFYEREGFDGRSFTAQRQVGDMRRAGFNDEASSAMVKGDRWEVCDGPRYGGRCVVLRPGNYPSLAAMGLNNRVSSVRAVDRNARVDNKRFAPAPVPTRITFYEKDGFGGRSISTDTELVNLRRSEFDDKASSVEVSGARWEVCDNARYRGQCTVLRPGRYPSLAAVGFDNRVSSVRPLNWGDRFDESRYAPMPSAAAPVAVYVPPPAAPREALYSANVISVRAVVGPPEQRCWLNREEVVEKPKSNVGGTIAGAVIGGILGHQVGGGRGKDLATVGGAIAGGAIGNQVGRSGQPPTTTQDVQRCSTVPPQARADLWDVTYNFRGQEHHVQMTTPPGATVTVNERGEPQAS